MHTGDLDLAQFQSVSVAVDDAMPPVLDSLRAVDPTFREVPHAADGRRASCYSSRSGFRVEFLTPNTGSDDHQDSPAPMPAVGGASAQPLRFLDFLIHEPVRAVLLHRAGVPVLVPAPERYAVHKLIVGSRGRDDQDGTAKSQKDRLQAKTLMEAMIALRRNADLAEAYVEAWGRGPAWREAIETSLTSFDEKTREGIYLGLSVGVERLGLEPRDHGLTGS